MPFFRSSHPLRRRGAAVALVLALAGGAQAHLAQAQPVTAQRQMAATANPLATEVALRVLREGGSAVDAAIAGQMVLAVVEPQASGLGGGSLLLVWDAARRDLAYYEGLASAPAGLPQDYAHDAQGQPIPAEALARSGRVVGVPGTLRTLALAHARHGRLPWPRLFQEAIALARDGFALPRYLHAVLRAQPGLAGKPGFGLYFGADGQPLPVGSRVSNPALAATLAQVATDGAEVFYRGPIAQHMVAAVAAHPLPGTLSLRDLAEYRPVQRRPVCLGVFRVTLCSAAPPAAGGIAVLQQLFLLEQAGIQAHPPGSLEAAHLFLEASRLTEADRRRFLGDPDQVPVPEAGLLEASYLRRRAALMDPARAMPQVSPGQPTGRKAEAAPSDPLALPATTHLSILDADGNAVSFTTTLNLNFGAEIVVDGVVLNNGVTNFATRPVVQGQVVANAAAPGKRPITTMAPSMAFAEDGRLRLILGAGGGARIIDSVAQTALGVLGWGLDVRSAIEQPRMGAQNRAEELEKGTAAEALAPGLLALGHAPKIAVMNAAVQAIAVQPAPMAGWADPHRDGSAAGD
ncbi:gamma-glutamyltransferase family protein [Roseomonas sp. GC11]|uniref:gamma-glutamyltransferase family protein n=1 Tax=Roseomonas sp. GC11 TaxID=2950546 RepID=UPI00210B32F6|nr:gamma-glutamyltransferase family protein [Roseomonas sp. GC11]MCQ4158694.1 gamma-glutamyltransferase family protein [Roseomonas sp. GC11]